MGACVYNLVGMTQSGSNRKVANTLVVMSSAAVLAVYAAGYTRTRSAADRFEAKAAERRLGVPGPPRTAPIAEFRPAAPNAPTGAPVASASSNPTRDPAGKPSRIASAEPVPTTANVLGGADEPSPAETPAPSSPAAPVASPVANQATEPAAPAAGNQAEVAATAPAAPAPAAREWKDGTWYGWGSSRHGDIHAEVVIEGGRISSAKIVQCLTRYSCEVIAKLPQQVPRLQMPSFEYVSGATESADAFYWAVRDALNKAW